MKKTATIRRQKISFKATKIVSRSARVSFFTKDGRQVQFKADKNIPRSVRVEFYARKDKK